MKILITFLCCSNTFYTSFILKNLYCCGLLLSYFDSQNIISYRYVHEI